MIDMTTKNVEFGGIERDFKQLPDLRNKKIIFGVELPITGISNNINGFFRIIQ